jgi:MFS family permease
LDTVTTPALTGAWSRRESGLLAVLAANMLIDAVEVSMTVVALPSAGRDLDLAPDSLQWLMTGFALGFGGLLLFGARLVAVLGRRPVYLAALLVFAVASIASALADDVAVLLVLRFVKGFCAALTAPTGLAIIATAFPEGAKRDRAMALYAFAGGSGFAVGLVLSGLLTGAAGWRWTFASPAPVVLGLVLLGQHFIPRETRPDRDRAYGFAAAGCLTAGSVALVCGIVGVPDRGWCLAAAVALLTVFVAGQLRSADPLARLDLLRNPVLVRSMLGAAALNGSYLGLLFVVTLQLQLTQGWSPLRTALAMLPASAPLMVTSLFSARLVRRFGAARLIALGAVPPVVGYAWYLRAGQSSTYLNGVLPVMVLLGAGFVLSFAALNMLGVSAVPPAERPMAAGLYQTAVQLAAAFVPAVVSALLAVGGFRPALWAITTIGALGLITATAGLARRHP